MRSPVGSNWLASHSAREHPPNTTRYVGAVRPRINPSAMVPIGTLGFEIQSADGLCRLVADVAQQVAQPDCSTAEPIRRRLASPLSRIDCWEDAVTSDEQAIRKLIATWLSASAAGDTQTVLSLMADDVVFLVPGQPDDARKGGVCCESKRAQPVPNSGNVGYSRDPCVRRLGVLLDHAQGLCHVHGWRSFRHPRRQYAVHPSEAV